MANFEILWHIQNPSNYFFKLLLLLNGKAAENGLLFTAKGSTTTKHMSTFPNSSFVRAYWSSPTVNSNGIYSPNSPEYARLGKAHISSTSNNVEGVAVYHISHTVIDLYF